MNKPTILTVIIVALIFLTSGFMTQAQNLYLEPPDLPDTGPPRYVAKPGGNAIAGTIGPYSPSVIEVATDVVTGKPISVDRQDTFSVYIPYDLELDSVYFMGYQSNLNRFGGCGIPSTTDLNHEFFPKRSACTITYTLSSYPTNKQEGWIVFVNIVVEVQDEESSHPEWEYDIIPVPLYPPRGSQPPAEEPIDGIGGLPSVTSP